MRDPSKQAACPELPPVQFDRLSLANSLKVPESSIDEISQLTRLHSSVWRVSLDSCHGRQRYFIKRGNNPEEQYQMQRQAQLMMRAESLFEDDPHYISLNTRYIADSDILVTQEAHLPCLNELLYLNLSVNPLRWYRDVHRAMELAGHWLRRLHDSHQEIGSPVPALKEYWSNRHSMFEILPSDCVDELLQALETCPDGNLTITHGDFGGWNILTNSRQMTVIDHGIREWRIMSPSWDVATFIVTLQLFVRGNKRTIPYWLPFLTRRFEEAFLQAYGDSTIAHSHTFAVCMALRYTLSYQRFKTIAPPIASWCMTRIKHQLLEQAYA